MIRWLWLLAACSTTEQTTVTCTPSPDTWETFAHGYMTTWCTSCHESSLVGEARYGAQEGVNFDTLSLVRPWGPTLVLWGTGDDPRMPPAGGVPQAQVDRFANWLACGLPGEESPAATACADAVPLAGDVEIADAAEAAALCAAGPIEILGDLSVSGDADLPCVCAVGGALEVSGGTVWLTERPPWQAEHLGTVSIGGELTISGDAVALVAPDLKSVGGAVTVQQVPLLAELDLTELVSVGGDVRVVDAPSLVQLPLPYLTAVPGELRFERAGVQLLDLTRLESTVGDLLFLDLPALVSLSGNTGALHSVGGSLRFVDLPAYSEAYGFARLLTVAGDLEVVRVGRTEKWLGFTELASIGGSLRLAENAETAVYDAFDTLVTVGGDLEIVDHPRLVAVDRFEDVQTVGGALRVERNSYLFGVPGLTNAVEVGSLVLRDLDRLDSLPTFSGLTAVRGDLQLANLPAVRDVFVPVGLAVLEGSLFVEDLPLVTRILFVGDDLGRIGGDLVVRRTGVVALDAPAAGADIDGSLVIEENDDLVDVTGLYAIDQVGGDLVVTGNPALPSADAASLVGEITVGGAVVVENNGP